MNKILNRRDKRKIENSSKDFSCFHLIIEHDDEGGGRKPEKKSSPPPPYGSVPFMVRERNSDFRLSIVARSEGPFIDHLKEV